MRFDCMLDDSHVLARGATATVFSTRNIYAELVPEDAAI